MFYHIDAEIDYARMGPDRAARIASEHAHVAALRAEGRIVVEWRKASNRGVIAIWDCADHAALSDMLRGLPLAPYLSRVEVTPLVPHPLWPDGRSLPEGAR